MADKRGKSWLKPGSKLGKLYNWLKREIVGTELLFTSAHAQQLTTELDVRSPGSVWIKLQQLDKKGLIKRKRRTGEKGLIVSFIDQNAAEVASDGNEAATTSAPARRMKKSTRKSKVHKTSLSIDELIAKLRSEVEELTARKGKLDTQIKQRKTLINQLTDASRL